jgi:hypothetical protein
MIDPWAEWDFNGFISSQRTPNNNMLSYTAQAVVCALYHPEFKDLIPDWLKATDLCEVRPGLYQRGPNNAENTSIDDYLSLAACDSGIALCMYHYGKNNLGFYDVASPNQAGRWSTWLWRFPGLVPHFKFGAHLHVYPLGRLFWAASVWLSARKPSQDGLMQTSLMILTYQRSGQSSWLCNKAVGYWKRKLAKPIGQVFGEYSGYPNHPLAVYWPEVK